MSGPSFTIKRRSKRSTDDTKHYSATVLITLRSLRQIISRERSLQWPQRWTHRRTAADSLLHGMADHGPRIRRSSPSSPLIVVV